MEAWSGVYHPLGVEPSVLEISPNIQLNIASAPKLIAELVAFGTREGLATEPPALGAFAQRYLDDDDLCDADMDLQTYAQLLIGAHHARARGEPLWIVK